MSQAPAEPAAVSPPWRKFGRGTVVPILLLVALLVLLGQMHIDLASGYTAPRMVGDEEGGFVFYHGGGQGFFYTRTKEGQAFGKKRWSQGVLIDATLTSDELIALYADKATKTVFYSVYMRKTLERIWSGEFNDRDLELTNPRHVATLGGVVYAFGTDSQGGLRVAKIVHDEPLAPVHVGRPGEPVLRGAGVAPKVESDEDKSIEIRPPLLFTSAVDGDKLTIFWRVALEETRPSKGEVRWTTFDGDSFGDMHTFPIDLGAMSATIVPGAPPGAGLRLYGVPYQTEDSKIRVYKPSGDSFTEAETIGYEREGFGGGAGVTYLTTGRAHGLDYLFAQIGAVIRYTTRDAKGWKPWDDFARRPAEQTAVIYFWLGSMFFLSGLLIYRGVVSLRRRRFSSEPEPVPAPRDAEGDLGEPATLWERAIAFTVDLSILGVFYWGVSLVFPGMLERAADEPGARLAIAVWFVIALLFYFIVFEALFARTPGKRLMDLEVQDVEGGRPGLAAVIYRNVFRVELLVPPAYLVPLLSLLVMISTRHKQRPGDLVARTAVRRVQVAG